MSSESVLDMIQGCLTLLCGLPASGKSTLASQLQDHAATVLQGDPQVFLIQYDRLMPSDLEEQLIQQSIEQGGTYWKSTRRQILSCIECLLNRLVQHGTDTFEGDSAFSTDSCLQNAASGARHHHQNMPENVDLSLRCRFLDAVKESVHAYRNCVLSARDTVLKSWVVLVDDNMQYSSMRHEYCQLAKRYEIGFCILHLSCPVEEAMARNGMREENKVAEHIILTMHERFEVPDPAKRPWEKYSLTVSTETSIDLPAILDLARQARADPQRPEPEENEEEKDANRFICSTNVVHQADQILRRCLSHAMASAKDSGSSKDELKRLATDLARHRTSILAGMRNGDIMLPFDPGVDIGLDASKDPSSRLYQFVQHLFYL